MLIKLYLNKKNDEMLLIDVQCNNKVCIELW